MDKDFFKKNYVKAIIIILSVALWLGIWELLSRIIGYEFIFPGVSATLGAFFKLIATRVFWKSVLTSVFRIFLGLIFGIAAGTLLAAVSNAFPPFDTFISIGMNTVKSTPVASIVMVLWIIIGSANLPTVIGLLMVMPIVWQNLKDGYNSIDPELMELSDAYEFTGFKRFRLLIFPALLRYFIPAILTSVGLAWKSGIAAEIIAYTKNSIGKNIYDAKGTLDTVSVFAWTLAVLLISIVFEFAAKTLLRRFRAYEPQSERHK